MKGYLVAAIAFGVCAVSPSVSSADDVTSAQKLVASTIASIDRAEKSYLRNVVTKPCTKLKDVLIDNMFAVCSSLGGVLGHRLLDSETVSCTRTQIYCGYAKAMFKQALQKRAEAGRNLPKKLNPFYSRVSAINRSIATINSQISRSIARRDPYAAKCALDPVINRGSCVQAASVNTSIERATARIGLKQSTLSVLDDGINVAYDNIARIVAFEGVGGYTVRVSEAYLSQQVGMCARREVACAPTPTPSPTPEASPAPEPTPG